MFLLSRMQDSVQVQPQDLGKTPVDAIRAELEASCYDKVLPEIGLAGKQLQLTQLSECPAAVCCTSTDSLDPCGAPALQWQSGTSWRSVAAMWPLVKALHCMRLNLSSSASSPSQARSSRER